MSLREESTSANSRQDQPWQVRLARDANEQVQSLSLMIQENDPEVKRQEVEKIQKLHQEGKLDLNKILVAVSGEEIRAALLMVIQKDQSAILWPPACDDEVKNSDSKDFVQDLLVQKACAIAKDSACHVIQTTVDCDDLQLSQFFSRNNLPAIGTILFLQRPGGIADLNGEKSTKQSGENAVILKSIAQEISDEDLGDLVQRTYVESADFPELLGNRTGAESLLTHRLQGEYHPEHWFVIKQNDIQVGVLFFSYHSDLNQWELSYLGIVPEHRGKGIARCAVLESFEHSQRKECGVFLGVDARNSYAVSLYESLGFVVVSRQTVHAWHRNLENRVK